MYLSPGEEVKVVCVCEGESLDRAVMLVSVQFTEGVQLPQSDGAISQSHEDGLPTGMQGDAL